jgi:hypothetical protein
MVAGSVTLAKVKDDTVVSTRFPLLSKVLMKKPATGFELTGFLKLVKVKVIEVPAAISLPVV